MKTKIENQDKVISKEQYQKISAKANLPMRCPILDICGRRMATIYFYSYHKIDHYKTAQECMLANREISSDFSEKSIHVGESVGFTEGDDYLFFDNTCPEVNLFDNYHRKFSEAGAITRGSFNYSETTKMGYLEVVESKHFSECPEFSKHAFESQSYKKSKTKSNQSARKGISSRLRFEIFQRDNFTCNYCGKTKEEDGIKLEIDHIMPVSEGGKDEFSNLITSCKDCNGGKSNKVI